jgi:hypothetical protein
VKSLPIQLPRKQQSADVFTPASNLAGFTVGKAEFPITVGARLTVLKAISPEGQSQHRIRSRFNTRHSYP